MLSTQLVAPPLRPHALPRVHLGSGRLRAISAPGWLTLVTAGAGWGKTTTWSRRGSGPSRTGRPAFSVDARDSDSVWFWGAVIAALDGVVLQLRYCGWPSCSGRRARRPPPTWSRRCSTTAALAAPVTLVVDDYHLADSAEIDVGVGFLATHLPATLRLALVSRSEPPLPLARLRGQGRVAELGTEDLRLSAAESAEPLATEGAARAPPDPVRGRPPAHRRRAG